MNRHSFFVAIENHSRIIQANKEDRNRRKKTEEKRQSRKQIEEAKAED